MRYGKFDVMTFQPGPFQHTVSRSGKLTTKSPVRPRLFSYSVWLSAPTKWEHHAYVCQTIGRSRFYVPSLTEYFYFRRPPPPLYADQLMTNGREV